MKKFLIISLITSLTVISVKSQNLGNVGIGTQNPDSSAQLELRSTNKGFLPPRVFLLSTNNPIPISKPAQGLLVYNVVSAGATPYNVRPGYYFWDGDKWMALQNSGNNPGDIQYWIGSGWTNIPSGLNGQVLTIVNGIPAWGNPCCKSGSDSLVIKPNNNPFELNYNSYNPDELATSGGTQMAIQAWTAFGNSLNSREILKFDFSTIPKTAVMDSAKLFLYAANNPFGGNRVDAHSGSSNDCYIQRIISSWSLPCPYSWNNPPTITTTNQAAIPQSSFAFEDNIIDVKALVADMIINENNGFLIRLKTEVTYNIRQYTGSYNANESKHPKLVIYYH